MLFEFAPEFSFIRHKETQKKEDYYRIEGYSLFENDKQEFNSHGFYFFINLFLERNHAIKFLKKIKGFKNESTPSFRATIQVFTAYTLRVPDVRLRNENHKDSLLMEMLNELNKCPKELFYHLTDKDKIEFEPKLDIEKKNNIIDNTNYGDLNDKDIDDFLRENISLKRHNDRFPYFALKYLDEVSPFENIRFQITIGKIQVKSYDKNIIGNRRILKTVNAYGKLSDFQDKESAILDKLTENLVEKDDIYFDQYAPHYNISNNKIAFYIFDENEEKISYPSLFINKKDDTLSKNNPTGFISINDLPKLLLLKHFNNKETEKTIIDFVKNENPKLFDTNFLDDIKKSAKYDPEKFTKRIINEKDITSSEKGVSKSKRVNFLSDDIEKKFLDYYNIKNSELLSIDKNQFIKEIHPKNNKKKEVEYFTQIKYKYLLKIRREELQKHLPAGMKIDMIPEKMVDYLMNINGIDEKKRVHKKVKSIKDEAKIKIKILEKELDKPYNERNIKIGEYATFIARDIISLVIDEDVKSRITSAYYGYIQNCLAFFSLKKEELITVCDELDLFDNKRGHIFLSKTIIRNSSGILDFCQDYLEEKIRWIDKDLWIKGKKGGYVLSDNAKLPCSYKKYSEKFTEYDFSKWMVNKSQMPVNLPRSLFDKKVESILKSKLRIKNIDFHENDKFSRLLAKIFRK